MIMAEKPKPRRRLPIGRTDALTEAQLQRVQALDVANHIIPSANRTAHNVTIMAEYIRTGRF